MSSLLLNGHALRLPLADESVQCCITSPPYWGLRKYAVEPLAWGGDAGCEHEYSEALPGPHPGQVEQTKWKTAIGAGKAGNAGSGRFCFRCGAWRGNLGHEPEVELFIEHLVAIFREVRRALKRDGTLWVVLGDSYARSPRKGQKFRDTEKRPWHGQNPCRMAGPKVPAGLKPKDLVGIPWRLAFALQEDGWWLRSDIIWSKPNCMPESVRDRPTKAHEYVFLLAKSERYYYDQEAVREPHRTEKLVYEMSKASKWGHKKRETSKPNVDDYRAETHSYHPDGRNRRTVWEIPTSPYSGAHFAAFPTALVEPMVLAGSRRGDVVLDPFCGTGTVGEMCIEHGRRFVGLDLSMEYLAEMARERTQGIQVRLGLLETTAAE